MREISVFDIIGPIMVGPSSSHTAGALRIAAIARGLMPQGIKRVKFILYGSFAATYRGHGTDRALLGGILGLTTDDMRIRESFSLADDAGLGYAFTTGVAAADEHPNTVDIIMTDGDGSETTVRGSSVGGGEVEITRINGTKVSFSGNYNALVLYQTDRPGVIAAIADVLGKHGVNVAFMQVYREGIGQEAVSLLEIDGKVNQEIVDMLKKLPNINGCSYIEKV